MAIVITTHKSTLGPETLSREECVQTRVRLCEWCSTRGHAEWDAVIELFLIALVCKVCR